MDIQEIKRDARKEVRRRWFNGNLLIGWFAGAVLTGVLGAELLLVYIGATAIAVVIWVIVAEIALARAIRKQYK